MKTCLRTCKVDLREITQAGAILLGERVVGSEVGLRGNEAHDSVVGGRLPSTFTLTAVPAGNCGRSNCGTWMRAKVVASASITITGAAIGGRSPSL